jgi:hypothetical protein
MAAAVNYIQTNNNIKYAGPLAGHEPGVHRMGVDQILVTEKAILIPPMPGEWTIIREILTNLLGEEQLRYFLGWLKCSLDARYENCHRQAQALVFAGARGSGKSFVQNCIITPLFGGRSGKPYTWMSGQTTFNADFVGTEHLMIEDEVGDSTMKTRRKLGSQLKLVTVNEQVRCEGKYQQAISMTPFWRLSFSINDEPENLAVLPPMDDSLEDKISLFQCHKFPMPHPTTTIQDRKKFRERVTAELPHLIHYLLNEHEIPEELHCPRFGVEHFHNPELLRRLNQLSPEITLLELIDMNSHAVFDNDFQKNPDGQRIFIGTAEELVRQLTGMYAEGSHIAKSLLRSASNCGTFLGRLAKKYPERVQRMGDTSSRRWRILERPEGAA